MPGMTVNCLSGLGSSLKNSNRSSMLAMPSHWPRMTMVGRPCGHFSLRNDSTRHGRHGIATGHDVPIGPGPLVHDARWRVLEGLAEIIQIDVAPDHLNLLDRS